MSNPFRYRMAIALLALVAALVALYLHLWKAGYTGALSCTSGHGCETAMLSPWGWFLGVDVALIGTIGY
ncbi:MAG: vitamin K epoxide reductase family protein, partial [Gemmatimonadales bacterium]